MSDAVDIVKAAREMVSSSRKSTHYAGCWRDHKDCMIVRLADEVERLQKTEIDLIDEIAFLRSEVHMLELRETDGPAPC
jgi:chlorite dismutase